MKPVTLDHLNLSVRNFAESADWYHRVFGFEVVEKGRRGQAPWGILRSGESLLCLYEEPDRERPDAVGNVHRLYHFALRVRDRRHWEMTLDREKLRTYFDSPVRYPHSTSWYVKDPTGYTIEVALWDGDQVSFGPEGKVNERESD